MPPGERLRRGRKRRWWHAARLPKPPCPYRRRHTHTARGVLTRQARRDRRPEPPPILTPRHPWPTRRPQDTSPGPIRAPLPSAHRNPFVQVLRRPFDSALHTAITVVDEAAAPDGPALVQSLLQRVQHKTGVSRAADTPADDAPCEDVDDEGDIDKTGPCRD